MPGNHKLYCLQGGSRSWEFGYREELERYAARSSGGSHTLRRSAVPWEDENWSGETAA